MPERALGDLGQQAAPAGGTHARPPADGPAADDPGAAAPLAPPAAVVSSTSC
jgi:hypothetical protein